MKTTTLLFSSLLAIVALTPATAQASFYRLYGRAQYQIFFGPNDNKQLDETNGTKNWANTVMGQTNDDFARTDMTVRFGKHSGSILCQGLFSNAYGEARTEEDITFTNPLGLPIRVQVNLVGAAAINHPDTVSVQRATSSLSVNGVVRVGYLDQFIGNSREVRTPVPFEFEVLSGQTVRLFQQTIFQVSGTGSNRLYFVSCQGGIQAEVKVMTPGAKMVSSTGTRYKPVLGINLHP